MTKSVRRWRWIGAIAAAILFGLASWCVAQTQASGVAPEDATFWRWATERGNWLMFVLGVMSVCTVAFLVYFFVILRESQVAPETLHRLLVSSIRVGKLDDARKACELRPCPLSAVSLTAIDHVRNAKGAAAVLLKDIIEGEGGRQAELIIGQTQYLLDIAVVAPMMGLLGTVLGMQHAFKPIASDLPSAKPVVLAEGLALALRTTVFGLLIGIVGMIFYAYFRRRASRLVSGLESASTDVLTSLLGRSDDELQG